MQVPIIIDVQIPSIQVDGVSVGREIVESRLGLDVSKVGNEAVADILTRLKALPQSELNTETQALLANLDPTTLISNITKSIRLVIINNLYVLFDAATNQTTMSNILYGSNVSVTVDASTVLPRYDNYTDGTDTVVEFINSDLMPRYDNYNLGGELSVSLSEPTNATTKIHYGSRNTSTSNEYDYASNLNDVSALPMFQALEGNSGAFFGIKEFSYGEIDLSVSSSKQLTGSYSGVNQIGAPDSDLFVSSSQISTVNLTLSNVEFTGQFTPLMVFS